MVRSPLRVACACAVLLIAAAAVARQDLPAQGTAPVPDGVHVTDGSCVMTAGQLQMNITNHGLLGSHYSLLTSYSDAPSAQWPAGSGVEHLFAAGLWIGAVSNGEKRVSTGQFERELRPEPGPENTIYEARNGRIVRPEPNPFAGGDRVVSDSGGDDDRDGRVNEEILDGFDQDGDGLIDEDFDQIGNQMMVCRMRDDLPVSLEENPDHRPLHVEVLQTSYAWEVEEFEDMVAFEFVITNRGSEILRDVYVGMFMDADIGPRTFDRAGADDVPGWWEGFVRNEEGGYEAVGVGYMRDAAREGRTPGWFGVTFLGPIGDGGGLHSFRHYTGERPYALGGDPTNDAERYQDLASGERDHAVLDVHANDFRTLVSTGPWPYLLPGASIRVPLAFVVGDGLDDLLENCAGAQRSWNGEYINLDGDWSTGRYGRETRLCLDDIHDLEASGLEEIVAAHADLSCVGMGHATIGVEDLFETADGRWCIDIDFDNCSECARIKGSPCTSADFFDHWNCGNAAFPEDRKPGCTGVGGREHRLSWQTPMPPYPPDLRLVPLDDAVEIYWNDRSERFIEQFGQDVGLEGYRVWRVDDWDRPLGSSLANGPDRDLWQLAAEFDVDEPAYHYNWNPELHLFWVDTLNIGYDTGLDTIRYRPVCLDDPAYEGLAEAMQEVVDGDPAGRWRIRPPVRDSDAAVRPGMAELLPWETEPAVLDTFYMATERLGDPTAGVVAKPAVRFYRWTDRAVHNGFLYFYAVTGMEHVLGGFGSNTYIYGPGLSGDPTLSFDTVTPGVPAQDAERRAREGPGIFVYPNPATPASLAELQAMHPYADDPTGLRIVFAHLPAAHNTLRIFTLDGDLVETLEHDGLTDIGETSWNLVSRNGQQVVSGIYLYVVSSDDARFDDFIGKFVLIR